jgi:CBS domain-containing protein
MHQRIIPDVVTGRPVYTLPKTGTAAEAAIGMLENNIAAIVVAGDVGKMVGIVTERDLVRRVMAKGLDPRQTTLQTIMTPDPEVLAPDSTAGEALELMRTRSFRHLPVCDADRVVAMVSIRDLYAAVKFELEENNREMESFVFGSPYSAGRPRQLRVG